jgi:uncharacterized surface protein with fasciclin (FAS1) repeats
VTNYPVNALNHIVCLYYVLEYRKFPRRNMNKTLTAFATASVMVLSACGGDDNTSDSTMESTPMNTTAESPSDSVATDEAMPSDLPEMEYGSTEAWGNIVEVARDSEGLAILMEAVAAAGLTATLEGDGPFTLFAPTDQAFNALPSGVLSKLLLPENRDVLIKVLSYHLVSGALLTTDLADGAVTTVEGGDINLLTSPRITLNGGVIRIADIAATNGVVHIIETVLLPPDFDPSTL